MGALRRPWRQVYSLSSLLSLGPEVLAHLLNDKHTFLKPTEQCGCTGYGGSEWPLGAEGPGHAAPCLQGGQVPPTPMSVSFIYRRHG